MKKGYSVNLIVLLVFKFDFNLTWLLVIFTFTSLGSKNFTIKLISKISYIPGGNVYPPVDPTI